MKILFNFLKLHFILGISVFFCQCFSDTTCIRGDNYTQFFQREEYNYEKLMLDINADVEIQNDTSRNIQIRGQKNIVEQLKSKVNKQILHFYFPGCVKYDSLNLKIPLGFINGIKVNSEAIVNINNSIIGNLVELKMSGSGKILTKSIDCQNINVDISGSGNIYIQSKSKSTYGNLYSYGSGGFYGDSLTVKTAFVNIGGSGSVRLNIVDTLTVRIYGSGNLYYKGNPYVKATIIGSGKLIEIP